MEITYIGHSCFKIRGKTTSVVIDPYDPKKIGFRMPKQSTDLLLISHHHGDHDYIEGVKDYNLLIETSGEYEVRGTFIYGIATYHDAKSGSERGRNTIYQIEMDGFSMLHLGDLGHALSKETLDKLTGIDILMIPVGGTYTINAKTAVEVISSLEPSIIIPMHYQTPDLTGLSKKLDEIKVFLDEMGIENNGIKKVDKLKINSRSEIPDESEVYLLKPQH